MRRLQVVFLLAIAVGTQFPPFCFAENNQSIDYNRQIRPLLSDRCFQCHGPDEANREADLRLDQSEPAYAVIEPGDPAASDFVERITSDDSDMLMPPPESGKSLKPEEIALLKQWIEEGAEYQPHWAFIAPKRSKLPEVSLQQRPRGAIDRFILAKLERQGLRPAAMADKITLLRRVTFDLTGLPPTREETQEFLNDESPNAYERVVDRLLTSPRYGEHMARYWLDAARYADTHGLHVDNYREMWPYRDWVLRAFNDNTPWDEFTIAQIAGDLKPEPTLDDQIASGFNRCHVTTNEGGVIQEEVYVRNVIDRVSTVGTVFLGLTMGCAVCHDHKFDPITMTDFYSTFAFFNNLDASPLDGNEKAYAPVIKVPSAEQTARLEGLLSEKAEFEEKLNAPWPEVDQLQRTWERQLATGEEFVSAPQVVTGNWYSAGPFLGDRQTLNNDKQGPEGKEINLYAKFQLADNREVKWAEQSHWEDGKKIDLPSDLAATFLYRRIESSRKTSRQVLIGSDDGAKVYLNGKEILVDTGNSAARPDEHRLTLELLPGDNHLLMKIMNYGGAAGFYFAYTGEDEKTPEDVLVALKQSAQARDLEQEKSLRNYYRRKVANHPEVLKLLGGIAEIDSEEKSLDEAIPTTLVMKERAKTKQAFLLKRGQYDLPDKKHGPLPRTPPSFLPPLPKDAPQNRLGYAQWLIAPDHPLLARVTVNRFWQQCFGTGLVETAGDFGSQGSWPSHPELLDWLAVDFRESGWDVKRFMKRIVMSSTYQQSSVVTPEMLKRDPKNRLLARGPRFRLDAEMLRDQALAVSGLLVDKLGGPGVRPPQPKGIWKAVAFSSSNTASFVADKGSEKVHRRSLYTFWKRTAPPPQMSTLDAPSRESCTVRRERTNTPLAALLLLNDPQYVEAARMLAQRSLLASGNSVSDVAKTMFELATLRVPNDGETAAMVSTFEESLQRYQQDTEATEQLLSVGEAVIAEEIAPAQVAAWTLVANAVLNLDELVTKE